MTALRARAGWALLFPATSLAAGLPGFADGEQPASPAPVPGKLRLEELTSRPWFELQPKEGSLLGGSFRILVNEEGRDWLRGRRPDASRALFVKLNRSAAADRQQDPEWQRARLEAMRPLEGAGRKKGEWEFFTFGPLGRASPQSTALPEPVCMSCHRRRSWRGEPLFVDFYADPDAGTLPARLTLRSEGDPPRLSVAVTRTGSGHVE